MQGRAARSPEPPCTMVGRKGGTGEAAPTAGWGWMWQHPLFSLDPCTTELENWLQQDTGTDRGEHGSTCFCPWQSPPGERKTQPIAQCC